ncbi:MAG: transcription termination/antitermination protein NusG [Planctomycetota bacterium]|jgi:transcriptional antiterminator NusG|nr:transcription termination/antitermination protein NusG [Planctomycetota bacterium]
MAIKWYFVRCQSGREDSIARNAITRLKIAGLQDVVPQVLVPFEKVTDLKNGKKRTINKKLYPGYLMVQADLEDTEDPKVQQISSTLREVQDLREFLGSRGEPTPLTDAEVTGILSRMSDSEAQPQVSIGLQKGDLVKIKTGAFDGFEGAIEDVNPEKGTVKVVVTIFNRPTPVEMEYWEVETI